MPMNEYTLRIDAFTPATLPMARLAEYIAAFADLLGSRENTHFVRLDEGSALMVSRVDLQEAPRVGQRLAATAGPNPPPDAEKAFNVLDDLLSEDNAIGELIAPDGAVIIPFPGRARPKALAFPTFRQEGSIDGQIVRIGGADKTAHIILQDGAITYSNIELSRELARELRGQLYEAKVRLFGSGRWQRDAHGVWTLLRFTVDRYEVLDDAPLSQVLSDIRAVPANALMEDAAIYRELLALRLDEDEVH